MASPTKWRESLEDLMDRHFRQHSDLLTNLMLRHYKLYKQEINKIKKSQDFMSTNFHQAFKSIKELKEENIELHKEDKSLQTRVDELDNNIIANEQEVESISSTFDVVRLYVRLSWNPSIRRRSNT